MCDTYQCLFTCGHSIDKVGEECSEVKEGKPCLFPVIIHFQRFKRPCPKCHIQTKALVVMELPLRSPRV